MKFRPLPPYHSTYQFSFNISNTSNTMWKLLLSCFAAAAVIVADAQKSEGTKYNFVYSVNDPLTHDFKNHWERRIEDKVQGSYKVAEADGAVRIVDYYADNEHGFRAVVRREGQARHEVAIPEQPYPRVVPLRPLQILLPAPKNYYGATFVEENDYGRGLGYL